MVIFGLRDLKMINIMKKLKNIFILSIRPLLPALKVSGLTFLTPLYRNNFDLVRVNYTDENSFGIYCNPLQDFVWSGHQATGNFVHGKIVTCGGNLTSL